MLSAWSFLVVQYSNNHNKDSRIETIQVSDSFIVPQKTMRTHCRVMRDHQIKWRYTLHLA